MKTLDANKTATFDVDAQYTFTPECPDELPVEGGTEIVEALNEQATLASIRVGSKDAHSPQAVWIASEEKPMYSKVKGENVDIAWNQHAVPGTKGFELIAGLPKPADYDFFIWKGVELDMHPYGACYHDIANKMSTGVIEYLKVKGIETVIVGGLATDYCVKTTALQLRQAGFNVIVNLEACRGISEDTVEVAIDEMRTVGIKIVNKTEELRG
ncbi:isochorismatase family protein [Aliikangiella coralliicola]|uniref:nicotinamidase n=1 Tax=Aliikangiella coralliicola TaxID=2592383 RepID=A0A545UET1_9GAMM|nr:isochorismatase family protein [Aliikangiella coralliicola]TQV87986.1 isochorismatase family protein [Aliikangiella coralliicola]